jgi:hypothetical protein
MQANPQVLSVREDVHARRQHFADERSAFVVGPGVMGREASDQGRLGSIGDHLDGVGQVLGFRAELDDLLLVHHCLALRNLGRATVRLYTASC